MAPRTAAMDTFRWGSGGGGDGGGGGSLGEWDNNNNNNNQICLYPLKFQDENIVWWEFKLRHPL